MGSLLKTAALIGLLLATGGLMAADTCGRCQKMLVIYSQATEFDRKLYRNICVSFATVKLCFKSMESSSSEIGSALAELGPDDLLVVGTGTLPSLSGQTSIVRYVSGGGKAFFAALDAGSEAMLRVAGVESAGGVKTQTGMKSEVASIFPGIELSGSAYSQMNSESVDVKLAKGAEVLYRAGGGLPLVWRCDFGKGTAIVCNSSLMVDARNAGLMLQLMSLQNDYFFTTVFNAKLFFIDDFPSPIPLGTGYVISSNYDGMGYSEFYKTIWWPQMKALAKNHNIKYTCLALGNYENSVKMPPTPLSARMKDTFKYYGGDIIESGHELGIHGYNHAPLLMADQREALKDIGYEPWKSEADMAQSLRGIRKALDEAIGKRQYLSYVPPMNMLAKDGKKALFEVFPEMKSFAGLGDASQHGDGVLYQDIGPDPDYPQIYALPRYSSGYIQSPQMTWETANYIAYCGVFSHFVHPDELLDNERSANKNWQELYEDLEGIMKDVDGKYPFLRPMSAGDFVAERERTSKTKVCATRHGDKISVVYTDASTDPMFHYLRLNNGLTIAGIENGKHVSVPGTEGLYLIEGVKSPVVITLGTSGGGGSK